MRMNSLIATARAAVSGLESRETQLGGDGTKLIEFQLCRSTGGQTGRTKVPTGNSVGVGSEIGLGEVERFSEVVRVAVALRQRGQAKPPLNHL